MDPTKKELISCSGSDYVSVILHVLIDVKRNFEQTNPFECFFTLP